MSATSTTIHPNSLWSRLRHSITRNGEPRPLRLGRLIADLTDGIDQHSPSGHNGVEISTASSGTGGSTVFLVHATGFCKEVWAPVLDGVATELFSWVSMDLRGHGASAAAEFPYDWDFVGRDIYHVLDGLKYDVGVGHSCGAAALIRCEVQHPGSFSRLILIEPIVFPPPFQVLDGPMTAAALKRRSLFESRQDAFDRFSSGPFAAWSSQALDGYLDGGFTTTDDGFELRCPPEVEADYYRQGSNHDTWILAESLELPVTLVVGEHSNTHNGTYLEALLERFAHVDLHVVAGAGHLVPMEKPDAIAALIDASISELPSAP